MKLTKKRSLLVMLIAILGAIAICGTILVRAMSTKDPLTRLMLAYLKTEAQRTYGYTADMSFSINKKDPELNKALAGTPKKDFKSSKKQVINFISEVLPKLSLKYTSMVNSKTEPICAGAKLTLNYAKKELLDAGFTVRPWNATIYSNALLNKPIYTDLKNEVNKKAGINIGDIKLSEYFDVLYAEDDFIKKLPESRYFEILKEKLKDNIQEEGSDKLVLSLKYTDTINLLHDIILEGSKDTGFRDFVIRKLAKIAETAVKNEDYKLTGLSKTDFEKQIKDAEKQISDNWEEILKEASKAYSTKETQKYAKIYGDTPIKYVYTLKDGMIDKIDGNISIGGIITTFSVTRGEFRADDLIFGNAKNSYNLKKIQKGDYKFLTDIQKNVAKILDGKVYKHMKADILKIAKKTLSKKDVKVLKEKFKQISYLK